MTKFCLKFFQEDSHNIDSCEQCKKAWDEVQKEDAIMAKVKGPLFTKTDEEKAALDCHGQP